MYAKRGMCHIVIVSYVTSLSNRIRMTKTTDVLVVPASIIEETKE